MTTARTSHARVPGIAEKLISWKSIASYFDCDARTAKRWERERGLPVHRMPGGKRSAVFAYSSELDSWLQASEQKREPLSGIRAPETDPADREDRVLAIESGVAVATKPALIAARTAAGESSAFLQWPMGLVAVAVILFVAAFLVYTDRHGPALGFSGVRAAAGVSRHVPAPGAEDLYLRGRYYWNLRTSGGLSKAIDAYTRSIVKDPSYAEAYAGLAESYDLLPQFAHGNLGEDFAQAKSAADRAIELNPNIAAAHRAKAFALFFWDWDISGSDAEFRRALALDPNSAETHQWYASTLLNRLEGAECLRQIDMALRLNPTSAAIATDAALMHEEFGADRDASVRKLEELDQTQPALLTPSYFLKQIYFARGDYPAYIAELQRISSITQNPDDVAMGENAERGWTRGGKTGMLEEMIGLQREAFKRGTEPGFWVGQTYLLLGDPEEALPYFKASLDEHFILLISMQDCDWAKKFDPYPGYGDLYAQIRQRTHGQIAHPSAIPESFRLPN